MVSRRSAFGLLSSLIFFMSIASISSTSQAAPAVDPVRSTVVASPTTVPLDSVSATKITVSAVGTNGKPVAIKSASILANPSTGLLTVAVASSNPPPTPIGQAVFYFMSTIPQRVTFTVVINRVTLQEQPVVTFTAPVALLQ